MGGAPYSGMDDTFKDEGILIEENDHVVRHDTKYNFRIMEENLNKFQVGHHPTVHYIPHFISETEEMQLLDKVYKAPPSKWKSLKNRRLQNWGGVVHEKGLLPQDLPSWLTNIAQRIYDESGLFPSAINHVLVNEYLPDQGIMPHQDGPAYFPVVAILSLGSPVVMDFTPHSRFRAFTNVEDRTFGGEALEVQPCEWMDNHQPFSVLLMPRSLLMFKDSAYSEYLHGIKDTVVQRYDKAINEGEASMQHKHDQPMLGCENAELGRSRDLKFINRTTNRISLTFRLVIKVRKNLFKF